MEQHLWSVIVLSSFLSKVDTKIRWIVNCPTPEITDGKIIPNKIKYAADELVEVECHEGHTLRGSARLKCHTDGTWSGSQSYCAELRCPKLPEIHGLKQSIKHSIDGNIRFECDKGFVMIGNSTLHCTTNGTWVPNIMPSCRVAQSPPLSDKLGLKTKQQSSKGKTTKASADVFMVLFIVSCCGLAV